MIYNNYTINLYELIHNFYTRDEVESWFMQYELSDYLTTDQINTIEKNKVWSKQKLAQKIVDHYLMEEIGFETPALFAHHVKCKMNEIMESKLPLIYSLSIEYDPLVNVDFTEDFRRKVGSKNQSQGSQQGSSEGNGSSLIISSETPQGEISKAEILKGNYATSTNASEAENRGSSQSSGQSSASQDVEEEYTKKMKGNSGVYTTAQNLIMQYRDTIRAVDREVINELSTLFMQIY